MATTARAATVLLALATVLLASCTRHIDDARAVAGPDLKTPVASDASQCETVDAPLTTIPAKNAVEPVMRIPQPPGWVRTTIADSAVIRFAMANQSLANDGFASNVVVAFEYVEVTEDAAAVFERDRRLMESTVGATELRVTEHTLCGLPAETIHMQIPAIGNVAARSGIALSAVLHTADKAFAVMVMLQTADPDNPTFRRDADVMLRGFQLLPPA